MEKTAEVLYNTERKRDTPMFPVQRGGNMTERVKRKSRCLLRRQKDMMRIIRCRVYDRVKQCLYARTCGMTMKERDEKPQGDRLKKKDRRAVLTLRQDWVARQTWHHKDKRKMERRKRERGERGEKS